MQNIYKPKRSTIMKIRIPDQMTIGIVFESQKLKLYRDLFFQITINTFLMYFSLSHQFDNILLYFFLYHKFQRYLFFVMIMLPSDY